MIGFLDKKFSKHPYLIFLISLVAWIGFTPLFNRFGIGEYFEVSMISLIDISAFYFFRKSSQKILAFVLAPLAISTTILFHLLDDIVWIYNFERYISLFLFLMITIHLMHSIVKSDDVDQETIYASAAGYIMIGIMFAILCKSFNLLFKGAYAGLPPGSNLMQHAYYAFVTMTTLGYGDMLPLIPATKSLAMFISLVGQFYMTVLIALLIGKYLHQLNQNKN